MAKKNQSAKSKGASRHSSEYFGITGIKLFSSGVLAGILICLLSQHLLISSNIEEGGENSALPPVTDTQSVGTATEQRPEIDFYTRLRDTEVLVPEPQQIEPREEKIYLLQAASFRNKADADRARAQLILLNLDANVTEFTNGSETWHRLMVGPFEGRSMLSKAQKTLLENGYGGMVLERSK